MLICLFFTRSLFYMITSTQAPNIDDYFGHVKRFVMEKNEFKNFIIKKCYKYNTFDSFITCMDGVQDYFNHGPYIL